MYGGLHVRNPVLLDSRRRRPVNEEKNAQTTLNAKKINFAVIQTCVFSFIFYLFFSSGNDIRYQVKNLVELAVLQAS